MKMFLLAFLSCTWLFMGWPFWFGVYLRGLPGLFSLDLFCIWRSCRAHNKGSCEILQLFLTRLRAFFLVIHHPFCFLMNALLTCVHLKFSCRTSRVDVEPGCWGYHLLYFPLNQETKTEKILYPRWVQKFKYDVGQLCFPVAAVLAGSMEFSGAFRQPSSFSSRTAGGILVMHNFITSGGSISVNNSSAKQYGGALPIEMSNSFRSFEGRVCRALSTRLPPCCWQCILCQCHGELQPM